MLGHAHILIRIIVGSYSVSPLTRADTVGDKSTITSAQGGNKVITKSGNNAGKTEGVKMDTYKITNDSNLDQECGHNHRSRISAVRCAEKEKINQYHILKNNCRSNGIGCWADGEPNY